MEYQKEEKSESYLIRDSWKGQGNQMHNLDEILDEVRLKYYSSENLERPAICWSNAVCQREPIAANFHKRADIKNNAGLPMSAYADGMTAVKLEPENFEYASLAIKLSAINVSIGNGKKWQAAPTTFANAQKWGASPSNNLMATA